MNRLRLQLLTFLLFVCHWTPLSAQQPVPQPTVARQDDADQRRDLIHRELDENGKAVQGLYQLLDGTPEAEVAARRYLESQIQQFDNRSSVLFEQLDAIDRQDFERKRHHDLTLQARRLEQEAKQLRGAGHVIPAALREAKAKSLRKSLSDGTWKLLVDDEWNCHDEPERKHELQLLIEVKKLKTETAALRQEVQLLRELVMKLTKQKHLSKQQ